jgi:hypothetical protein
MDPRRPDAFDAWLSRNSLRKGVLRGWFAAMGDRLTTVDVDGQDAHILSEHADDLSATEPSPSVRLLGDVRQYVLGRGSSDRAPCRPSHRARSARPLGWISPIVVVDGRIAEVCGSWTAGRSAVSLFGAPTDR